jgi:bacillithiol biosynthesis deacetylase BshB1
MKIDLLAFGAHPDDVELSAGGALLVHKKLNHTIGIIDLTHGELGTRGTAEIRDEEAKNAAKILGVDVRESLNFSDGFFSIDEKHLREVVRVIRTYQPDIILCNAPSDRHPDHGRGGQLVKEACFLSGLRKIETQENGVSQKAWRPKHVFQYIQDEYHHPDFLLDISGVIEKKMEAIRAFRSQFFNPDSNEPETYISTPEFMSSLESRASLFGRRIGVKYAEGFLVTKNVGVKSFYDLI